MADTGAWNVSPEAPIQTVYVNFGPTQGPLVVYRIHNDGPETVFATGSAGSVTIPSGCDCDMSGSPIETGLLEGPGHGESGAKASGTYELVCCQSGPVTVQPPPPPPPPPSG